LFFQEGGNVCTDQDARRKQFDDARKCRVLLLQICALMIENGIVVKSGVNGTETKEMVRILASRDDLAQLVARLVQIVVTQMKDREESQPYPNEDNDALIQQGFKIWG
jgi:hypothetical protein